MSGCRQAEQPLESTSNAWSAHRAELTLALLREVSWYLQPALNHSHEQTAPCDLLSPGSRRNHNLWVQNLVLDHLKGKAKPTGSMD